jgi:hypothetical protein
MNFSSVLTPLSSVFMVTLTRPREMMKKVSPRAPWRTMCSPFTYSASSMQSLSLFRLSSVNFLKMGTDLRKSMYSAVFMRPLFIIIVWKICRLIAQRRHGVAAVKNGTKEKCYSTNYCKSCISSILGQLVTFPTLILLEIIQFGRIGHFISFSSSKLHREHDMGPTLPLMVAVLWQLYKMASSPKTFPGEIVDKYLPSLETSTRPSGIRNIRRFPNY